MEIQVTVSMLIRTVGEEKLRHLRGEGRGETRVAGSFVFRARTRVSSGGGRESLFFRSIGIRHATLTSLDTLAESSFVPLHTRRFASRTFRLAIARANERAISNYTIRIFPASRATSNPSHAGTRGRQGGGRAGSGHANFSDKIQNAPSKRYALTRDTVRKKKLDGDISLALNYGGARGRVSVA